MKKLIFLLVLLSIVVTIPISGEEVTLTTIVPDQTILRGRQGAVGEAYRSYPATSIPASGLLVEGNVGIGTGATILQQKLEVNGHITAVGGVKVGTVTAAASAGNAGTIRYDSVNGRVEYSNGTQWGGWEAVELYNLEGANETSESGTSVTGTVIPKPKRLFMTVDVYSIGSNWRTVSWTNTPFTNIHGILVTFTIKGGLFDLGDVEAQIISTSSFKIHSDHEGWCSVLLVGD